MDRFLYPCFFSDEVVMDLYGVIGNPIQHSQSPLIHRLFADQTNQVLSYNAVLAPLTEVDRVLNDFRSRSGCGLNVTAPFKQLVYPLMDEVSPRAKIAGSINTITFHSNGACHGDNTDGIGLIRDMTINQKICLKNKTILLLGAGGAIRGVLAAILHQQPRQVVIANRSKEKALTLVSEFAEYGVLSASELSTLSVYAFDIVINGTSPALPGGEFILPNGVLNADAYCYDMVYGQGMTPFLRWAAAEGCVSYNDGLGMLVEQAAESFAIWRNIRPNTAPVLSLLRG
jgi:shikimate dehydrogenase